VAGYLAAELAPAAPAPDAALDRLEELERSLAALDGDERLRRAVADRLRRMLAGLDGSGEPAESGAALDEASASELFAFIDNELGRATP
jgi:polyene macrolide polyketide synthase